MNITKETLDLKFLYPEPLIRDHSFLGEDSELANWQNKYYKEEQVASDFIEVCSTNDFIYLIVSIFKENFPYYMRFCTCFAAKIYSKGKIYSSESTSEFYRMDLVHHKISYHVEMETLADGFEEEKSFEKELLLEFNYTISTIPIEQALEGLKYEKSVNEGIVNFEVENAPIQSVCVEGNSLTLITNPAMWVKYI